MSIRKVLFWLHLSAGCIGGLIVLTMCITGVILMYERQILARVERGPFRSDPPAPGASKLAVEELLAKVSEQRGRLPPNATLTLRSDPREPAELATGRESAVYIQPYTGRVLGPSSAEGWRSFFQQVTAWHRWLGARGEGRTVAKAVTGACNLAFLLLIVTGPILWLPKQWSRRHLAPIVWFRQTASGKARDFNWHNVIGIWSAVPLFFVVLTAVPMSYTWGNNLIYKLTGTEPPAFGRSGPGGPFPGGGEGRGGRRGARGTEKKDRASGEAVWAGLNRLWKQPEIRAPGWRSMGIRLPESPGRAVSFSIDMGDGGQPQNRATLTFARASDEVRMETFASLNAGRRVRSWSRFVHTGEAFGFGGQTVAGIASAGGVMLVWTGIALSLRRFAGWRRRRTPERELELTNIA